MKVLVYNLAAEYAGALTILENFYHEVITYPDKSIQWYFLVSTNRLQSRENVMVISEPWVKKSWFHRIYYDMFVVRKVINEKGIDLVYSMQNMPVRHTNAEQVVYLHQSLQFSPVKFSLFDKEQRSYAVRQKFVCNIYKKSLRHADRIIVQTKWFKDAVSRWIPFNEDKIDIVNPEVHIDEELLQRKYSLEKPIFFYPAGDGIHKNHEVILQACELLEQEGITNYQVIFTLNPKTAVYSERIMHRVNQEKLNVELTGIISKNDVYELYSRSVLLFPSYMETFGLPLLEAKMLKGIILASDMPFCHEILDGYQNAYFYNIHDAERLADLMKKIINGSMEYHPVINSRQMEEPKKRVIDYLLRSD